jgi:hypothetical protein
MLPVFQLSMRRGPVVILLDRFLISSSELGKTRSREKARLG